MCGTRPAASRLCFDQSRHKLSRTPCSPLPRGGVTVPRLVNTLTIRFALPLPITTSGFFSDTALVCSMMEMGIDRILFSVDYPFAENPPGTEWLKTLPLGPEDTEKLLNGNARRLLKL